MIYISEAVKVQDRGVDGKACFVRSDLDWSL
jgi:hypothetical protein